jgi:hypothetical protein
MKTVKKMRAVIGLGVIAGAMATSAVACTGDLGDGQEDVLGDVPGSGNGNGNGDDPNGSDPAGNTPTILDERTVDYSEAYRLASVKLRDLSPSLEQIRAIENADDKKAMYEQMIDELVEEPRFQRRMIRFWRDTFRQGGGMLDTAPVFAARIVAEGRPYTDLFTATENTCPTYDGETETFVDGNCDNGVTEHAGVLTNPGVMRQFYANMAFRRVRWVQETFACSKFPAEYSDTPVDKGNGQYTAPWDFESIATEPIDFQDTSSVICANCHTTMNRLAPLFAYFDEDGNLQNDIQVMTPTAPDPTVTELSHWLQPGVTTAWRQGVEVETLPELGQALANDTDVAACLSARLWNFALSKEDIVSGLAVVPGEVIDVYVNQLANNGGDLKDVIKSMFKSEDFVSF